MPLEATAREFEKKRKTSAGGQLGGQLGGKKEGREREEIGKKESAIAVAVEIGGQGWRRVVKKGVKEGNSERK
jgi:hypothetical protein